MQYDNEILLSGSQHDTFEQEEHMLAAAYAQAMYLVGVPLGNSYFG